MGWFEGKRLGPTWSGQIQWPGVGGVCWILNGGRDGYTVLNYIEQLYGAYGGAVRQWMDQIITDRHGAQDEDSTRAVG